MQGTVGGSVLSFAEERFGPIGGRFEVQLGE